MEPVSDGLDEEDNEVYITEPEPPIPAESMVNSREASSLRASTEELGDMNY